MSKNVILAVDLGTSAFKCAAIDRHGRMGPVTSVPYRVEVVGSQVTANPVEYEECVIKALIEATYESRDRGQTIDAIGITSQAQTFVTLDVDGKCFGPAMVWSDSSLESEAEQASIALPDFPQTSGFTAPSPLQFLTKVTHKRRTCSRAQRFLLLNEWVALLLTGHAFGDDVNQGMGGFWDIRAAGWNPHALTFASIGPQNLASVAPAGKFSAMLDPVIADTLSIEPIPVFSCGNDQSCAAIGAGIHSDGDRFCNFGTAMVVYGMHSSFVQPSNLDQIAGVSPLTNLWFLLAVESDCGSLVDDLTRKYYSRRGVARALQEMLSSPSAPGHIELARLSDRFGELLDQTGGINSAGRLIAGGGLASSPVWINFLNKRHAIKLIRSEVEQPGLLGVARVLNHATGGEFGAPF